MMSGVVAQEGVHVGEHITVTIGGLTFNLDTIWSSVLAGVIVVGIGLYMRARITHGVPSKLQLLWETIVDQVQRQVDANVGPVAPHVVPLAVTLFFYIWIANWIEIVPTGGLFPSPSSDTNFTYALAFFVIVWVHITGLRSRGLGGYVKHFFQPYIFMFPINLVEEIVRPFTLALRLFGNLFAGAIMISLIGLFPLFLIPVPGAAWRLFEMAIGLIQAFIFALLTILYFGFAVSSEEGH